MTVDLKDIAVLVPGRINRQAGERIEAELRLLPLPKGDPSLVTAEMAASVRGVAGMTDINAAFIDALPKLEIIANYGVGYDGVDAEYAASKGIMVTNTPDVLTDEVADTALGLLIATVRELPAAERWLRDGRWAAEGPFHLSRGTLRGRKVGIFGMGRIGQAIARRVEALGLPVSYHNRRKVEGSAYAYHDTLLGLAQAVDTLIAVAPATPETEKAVNDEILRALGAEGVFVNVGRGSTVDEAALIKALGEGTILAAGLDVFADEPRVPQALVDLPNTVLLPHVASASVHTRNAMADLCVDNLVSWFTEGKALTPVAEAKSVRGRRDE